MEISLAIGDFSPGLIVLPDEASAPLGSARLMENCRITDRKGIAKRQGVSVIGDGDSTGTPVGGLFRFLRADGTETLVKARGTVHRYLNGSTWATLESSLTSGSSFGYASHIVNTDFRDYLYWGNRTEAYRRWNGAYSTTTATLAGGETSVPVVTTLFPDVYDSKTSSASSTTTLDITPAAWATSQWVGFYVLITNGASIGKVSRISANTTVQLTFATITGLSGTPTFTIRRALFDDSGTVVISGTDTAYSAIATSTDLTVTSAPACASGSPVAQKPTAYVGAPYGNRLTNCLTRMYVGNIRSMIGYDGAGNKQGVASNRSVCVSKLLNATDFSFAASRAAGEGDIIELAYGGGFVNDVVAHEDSVYAFTPEYIESISYGQDSSDLTVRKPLKPGIGNVGRAVKGKDDIYFATPRNEITSVGRVKLLDTIPQSLNIGLPIKRLLDGRDLTAFDGMEFKDRLHFTMKSASTVSQNDRITVYNRGTKSWEGDWLLGANQFAEWNGKLAFGQSVGSDAMKLYDGDSDIYGGVSYPIVTKWKSNWINVTKSKMENESVCAAHFEGYIRGNSSFEWQLMGDFSEVPFINGTFSGSETSYIDGFSVTASMGETPLGSEPMGSVEPPDADGLSRFRFTVWFPDTYLTNISVGLQMGGIDEYVEIIKVSLSIYADPLSITPSRIK